MKFKTSFINQLLSLVPENLQIEALKVIKSEHDRFKREDFTSEEKMMSEIMDEICSNTSDTIERIASEIFCK